MGSRRLRVRVNQGASDEEHGRVSDGVEWCSVRDAAGRRAYNREWEGKSTTESRRAATPDPDGGVERRLEGRRPDQLALAGERDERAAAVSRRPGDRDADDRRPAPDDTDLSRVRRERWHGHPRVLG